MNGRRALAEAPHRTLAEVSRLASTCRNNGKFSNLAVWKMMIILESKGRCAPGTNALSFSASARHVYDYLAANASTAQYEYRTSNRRAPYEYCSRILLCTDKARGDVVYFSYNFVTISVWLRDIFV